MDYKVKRKHISYDSFKKEVLKDFEIINLSRECSIEGRKEVLTGKASFGIFGDGKELPQIAMAKYFKKGDFRSGYYRDQTFMFAINELTTKQFFSGLYAHTDLHYDPMSAGRQMGSSFSTHSLDDNYNWKNLKSQYNSSADLSPTASQMPRILGLAQASKIYKETDAFFVLWKDIKYFKILYYLFNFKLFKNFLNIFYKMYARYRYKKLYIKSEAVNEENR